MKPDFLCKDCAHYLPPPLPGSVIKVRMEGAVSDELYDDVCTHDEIGVWSPIDGTRIPLAAIDARTGILPHSIDSRLLSFAVFCEPHKHFEENAMRNMRKIFTQNS